MTESYDVLIVGAGHAGAHCAIALRQKGFAGRIALVGDEREQPYERPPLSKDYLAGTKAFDRMAIRPDGFWAERAIDLRPGHRVTTVDVPGQAVTLSDGSVIGFDRLVWAAGGSPRMLACPGGTARNVFPVRRRSDVDAIRAALPDVTRTVIVGGGYIGLEVAAVLRGRGIAVTLLESCDRVLSRVAGADLSRFFEDQHRARGVDVRLGVTIERIVTDGSGRAVAVELGGGEKLPCDLVIVGIGIVPEVGPLIAAGASGGNGVDVDARCRTSLPGVYAIGDCAAHANAFADGAHIRVESVQNAHDMAAVVAADICGESADYCAIPWFWSNQYEIRLQTVGLSAGHDAAVVRGDPDAGRFSVVYLREGRVIALDCVNSARDYVQGRGLIEQRVSPDTAVLADATVPLKALLP